MELVEFHCKDCGGNLKIVNGVYQCQNHPDHFFVERDISDQMDKLRFALGEAFTEELLKAKEEKIANLRSNLWEAVHKENGNSREVLFYCRELKTILPDDFLAKFYETATLGSAGEVNILLNKIDTEKYHYCIKEILDYVTNPLLYENLTSVRYLIERAYKDKNAVLEEKYNTICDENEKLIREGVYNENLPRDVFIAYKSKDIELANELCDFLESNNIKCFLSSRNLQHGRGAKNFYEDRLKKAIDHCKVIVFVSTYISRTEGDAIGLELPYVEKQDILNAPSSCRYDYRKIPQKYKMPRVEYLKENYVDGDVREDFAREFFKGFQQRKTLDTVFKAVDEYLKAVPDDAPAEDVKWCKNCGTATAVRTNYCGNCGRNEFFATQKEYIDSKIEEEVSQKTAEENARMQRELEAEKRKARQEAEKAKALAEAEAEKAKQEKKKLQEERENLRKAHEEELTRKQRELFERMQAETAAESAVNEPPQKCDSIQLKPLTDIEIPKGCSKKIARFYKSAKKGNKNAQFELGWYYDEKQDYEQANEWYYRAAEAGHKTAQSNLGFNYEHGYGVECDYEQAVKWYKLAAEKGDEWAQNNLGICYEYGRVVEQDMEKAIYWYKKSAKQGGELACKNLARIYDYGKGVDEDQKEANKWNRRPNKIAITEGLWLLSFLAIIPLFIPLYILEFLYDCKILFPAVSGYLWVTSVIINGIFLVFYILTGIIMCLLVGRKKSLRYIIVAIVAVVYSVCMAVMFGFTGINQYDLEMDGVLYKIQEDGTVSVCDAEANIKNVTIPEEINGYRVTSISENAFSNCDKLSNIKLPDSITSIGNDAFFGCKNLTNITIPQNVVSIGTCVFQQCSQLTEVYFNAISCEDLENGSNTFSCKDKNETGIIVSIGANVTKIPAFLFANSVSDGWESYIKEVIFEERSLCESIGKYAFCGCKYLTDIVLPENLKDIGYDAFWGCESLINLKIPDKIQVISTSTFENCAKLSEILIPISVTSIYTNSFDGCENFKTIYYCGNTTDWEKIYKGSGVIDSLQNTVIYYYAESEPTEDGNFWHYVDGEPVKW